MQNHPEEKRMSNDTKTFGQIGYEAYGEMAGVHGAWKTFDGRDMPKWEALHGEAGELTKARWEVAAKAMIREHFTRLYPDGPKGPAITPNPVGA
jgi:hypothetical protein